MRMICIALLAVVGILVRDVQAREASARPQCTPPVEKESKNDEAQFECSAKAEFPREEYEKTLSQADEETKELIASYETPIGEKAEICPATDRQISEEETAADQAQVNRHSWIDICASYSYTIWWWGINIPPYGRCYVLTPIRVTKCSRPNSSCRYIYPYFWSRCRQGYSKVYFLSYCPRARHPFVWRYRWVPTCCNCQRLVCRHGLSSDSRN